MAPILEEVPGIVVRRDEPLSKHLPWRTGGPCAAFVVIERAGSAPEVLAACKDEDVAWQAIGAGTRTVARDAGINAIILRLGSGYSQVRIDGSFVDVGAGAPVPALAAICASSGLGGIDPFAGTPGTVGAALIHDSWKDVIESVRVVQRGQEREVTAEDLVRFDGRALVVGARLKLRPEPIEKVWERTRRRMAAQSSPWFVGPKKTASVPASHAVREVLVHSDLASVRLRDVMLPTASPEWVTNLGGASARDLHLLHASALDRVVQRTGVELRSRVGWIGRSLAA